MEKEIRPENDVTKLTVHQVILLVLLVTLVASVATGIVVAQLVGGVPGEPVFQTIERVTETVVEKTVPAETPGKTIVIKEGDLVAKAVAGVAGTALPLYMQTREGEVIDLGHGIKISDKQLISAQIDSDVAHVNAGLLAVADRGSDKIMLWESTIDGDVFSGPYVDFAVGDPQVGQTVVYVGGNGSIVRSTITEVSSSALAVSDDLAGKDVGLVVDIGGDVIALWTGEEIIRSTAVDTQVDQLSNNPISVPDLAGDFEEGEVPTNPKDVTVTDKKSACELIGGTFNEHSECAGINADQCLVLGGEFQECASACRHDVDAEICTQQCVIFCQL